jgi:hypothetical protein
MGGAQRASAASDEASRVTADEAGKPVISGTIVGDEVVMHGDGPRVEPARRAGDRLSGGMEQHEPAG